MGKDSSQELGRQWKRYWVRSSRELFKSLEEAQKIPEPTVTRGEKEDTGSVTPEKAEADRQKMIQNHRGRRMRG